MAIGNLRVRFLAFFSSILIIIGSFSTTVIKFACIGKISKVPWPFLEDTEKARVFKINL